MNNEENKVWFDLFIKDNPCDFKQGIISHCRHMDKIDVYEWVAEDELKIQKLHQEKQKLEHNWNELKKWLEEEKPTEDMNENFIMIRLSDLRNKMQELEEGGNND